MINFFDEDTPQPLIVLKGEYGIISGDNSIIASPNAKNGVVMILSDAKNKVTALAHFDESQDFKENIENIIAEMIDAGADLANLKCNLTENEKRHS